MESYINQVDFFKGNDPEKIAQEYGTPLYVYNEEIGYHLLKTAYGADGAFVEYAYTNTDRMSSLPYRNLHIFGVKWLF